MTGRVFVCLVFVLAGCRLDIYAGGFRDKGKPTVALSDVVKSYAPVANRIITASVTNSRHWTKMQELCDDIGHRLSGSVQLEKAIEWAVKTMKGEGHENVAVEKVMVPKWVRGAESVHMVAPVNRNLPMLGLGGSIGTSAEGVTAEVEVVESHDELLAMGDKVRGKIVLFNVAMPPFHPIHGTGYGKTVKYRHNGARWAAKHGAVGALMRSVTAHSLRSPHTGMMGYGDAVNHVPSAAITIEDSEAIARHRKRGQKVVVTLKMQAKHHGDVPSGNVVAELVGRTNPEEIVVISGHLDSWDVGDGAHDDATGVVAAMEALTVLRKLGLKPRRTIRVVLWTNEENGLRGGRQYVADHKKEMSKHVVAIESDSGCFGFEGYSVDLEDNAREAGVGGEVAKLASLMAPLNGTKVVTGWAGADISFMKKHGVPLLGLKTDMSKYFDIHHTHADTLDKVDPEALSHCVAGMAVMAYVLADMPGRLGDTVP